jgi:hypothetical protein
MKPKDSSISVVLNGILLVGLIERRDLYLYGYFDETLGYFKGISVTKVLANNGIFTLKKSPNANEAEKQICLNFLTKALAFEEINVVDTGNQVRLHGEVSRANLRV